MEDSLKDSVSPGKGKIKKPKAIKNKNPAERLICDLCGKTFCNKTSIKGHMERIHKKSVEKEQTTTKTPNPKTVSKEKDVSSIRIERNENESNEIKTEKMPEIPLPIKLECGFSCPICSKQFTKKRYVEEHIRGVHLKIPRKPYNKTKKKYVYNRLCSICGQSFDNISSYRSHYKRHFPEQCLSCRYCGKLFTGASILKIHELIHTGEKPFRKLFL